MNRREQGEWQKADARVLGQILAAQNIVFTLPDTTRIAEFYAQTLITLPGIMACRVCLGGKSVQAGEVEASVCAQCEALHATAWDDSTFSPAHSNFKCGMADQPDTRFIALDSYQHHFGFLVLKIKNAAIFDVYHPFILNLSNYLAITLENRWQKELLQKAHAELERKVEERTYDLTVANADLQREVTHRQRAEEALIEQFSTLRGIIDSANALIFSVDRQYRYTSFNQKHAAAIQALYGAEIETGHSLLEYMTVAEDRETAKRNLDRALVGEQIVEEAYSGEELRSRRYFQVSHSPIKTETGDIIGVAMLAQDITKRKQAEESLRESQQRYRDIFDNVLDGLYLLEVTKDGRFRTIEVNPALERATGVPRSQSVGKTQEEIVPEETARLVNTKYRRCVEAGQPIEEEVELDLPSGRLVFHSTLIPARDETGHVNRIIGISRDITERKRAEQALRRLNRELQALSNCNQSLLRAVDEQTLLNEICHIICEKAGYLLAWVGYTEHDEAKTVRPVAWAGFESDYVANAQLSWADTTERGRGPAGIAIRSGEIFYAQDFMTDSHMAPWREDALRRGYRSGIALPLKGENAQVFGVLLIYSAEVNIVTPDEIRLMQELSGDLAFGITTLRLRIKRKQAEESLRKLSHTVEQSPISIMITDTTGAIEYVNPRFTELTGYAFEEVLGQNPRILKSGKTSLDEYQLLWKTISSGGVWQGEFCNKKKNGELYWEWAFISPVIDRAGVITNFVATKENITERKKAEQELEQYREHLEELVAKRTIELQTANEQLLVLSRAKDAFVSNVSHELRTPITNLKMREYLLKAHPERFADYLQVIERETDRLAQIIENLLLLSRMDQERTTFSLTPVDLNRLLGEYVFDRMLMAEDKNLSLIFRGEPDLPKVMADANLIGQALSVLLTNALNYTPAEGQVIVQTHTRSFTGQQWAGFSVIDTGLGIAPDEQPKLFTRFFRGQTGRMSGVPGTGLGLAIAKEIVDRHNGRIEIKSEGIPGQGTTFTVWMPALDRVQSD